MTKATLSALLDAESDADFDRAWSTIKKTKRESKSDIVKSGDRENREFGWHRWVDREYEDEARKTVRARRMARKRKRGDASLTYAQGREEIQAGGLSEPLDGADEKGKEKEESGGKLVRRRSNLFEVLNEVKEED